MIVSPPFLPQAQVAGDDQAYVDSAMLDSMHYIHAAGNAPGGSYPLGAALTWHNGVHLRAPIEAQRRLPVRAIADGTVIFKRETSRLDNPALTYNPFGLEPTWTDNGIVIIRHTTDIGATGNTPSSVTYYSVYMHLSSIEAAVEENKPIWRKDKIGQAGQIYGEDGEMHFEICMNAANLQALVGAARPITWAEPDKVPTADGRTDAVYGSVYIYLPKGAPTCNTLPNGTGAHLQPAVVTTKTASAQWVEISYSGGQGTVRSYRALDGKDGVRVGDPIGQALTEPDFEYNLYTEANHRHDSLDSTAQARSSPSGWYELLRFGRNLGPDRLPDDAAHWRRIPTDGGTVWADLNAAGTFKFSDADFPVFKGWQCFDDDTSHDNQRCDSIELKRLIRDPSVPESIRDREALAKRLGKRDVREKLKRTICKFPTEWDRATVAERYGWLKVDEEFKMEEGEDWGKFKAHCEAVSFGDLPQEYKDAVWHFHPRAFIAHMRKCGWLSRNELWQMFPVMALRRSNGHWVNEAVSPDKRRLLQSLVELNRATRKYCITTPARSAAFYGNAMQETQWFLLMAEGDGAKARYAPWYGRGYLQLTWPDNYIRYFRFKGQAVSSVLEGKLKAAANAANISGGNAKLAALEAQVPADLQSLRRNVEDQVREEPTDSAGAYWAWSLAAQSADLASPFVRVTVTTSGGPVTYYEHASFGNVAATVNVGQPSTNYSRINGVQARFQAYAAAVMVLLDQAQFPDAQGKTKDRPEGWARRMP